MKRLIKHSSCLSCAGCVGVCPYMALDMVNVELQIDQEKCRCCGICVRACPVSNLEIIEVNFA